MSKQVTIELPDELSSQGKALAREAAVVALQQAGELTIREAAGLLGLEYEGYLALVAEKGLPASNAEQDPEALESLRSAAVRSAQRRDA